MNTKLISFLTLESNPICYVNLNKLLIMSTDVSYNISHLMAKHSKSFAYSEFLKTVMSKTAPSLFQDFNNKEKTLQRISKMSVNIPDQLQTHINSCDFNSIYNHEFSSILGNIKVQFSQRFRGFKRIEKLIKTISHYRTYLTCKMLLIIV